MDRRAFIKLTAITGTSATLARCGNPEHQLIRFIPDEDLVPGIAQWKPSICPGCQAGCGLHVRVMEADADVTRNGQAGVVRMNVAKKLEGNPAHPVNQGALCPRGQASIQITYHPDRIAGPLKRTGPRGSGQFQPVSWDDAIAELVARLDDLAASNGQQALAFLTSRRPGVRHDVVARFLRGYGAPPPVVFELFGDEVLRRANGRSFGREQLTTFDLARTRLAIAFGADFLATWNSPVAQNAGYGRMRQGQPGVRGRFIQVESRMSQTGANADEWVPIKPGTDGVLALGLAHVLISEKLRAPRAAGEAGAHIEGWSDGLREFAPAAVEERTGVPAARVQRLARELAQSGPALALIGGAPLAHTNGLFNALAVNALNALIGAVEQPGGLFFTPGVERMDARTIADVFAPERPPLQALLVDTANPVFATPRAWRVREAIEKVPFIASFGNFVDETSVLSDLILPDHSFLESWVDAAPESGALVAVRGVAPPAMRPLLQTRSTPDVLLDVGRRLKRPLTADLPWESFEAALEIAFRALPGPSPDDVWSGAQEHGGWWGPTPSSSPRPPGVTRQAAAAGAPARFVEPQFDGAASEFPFHFLPYASQAFLDGSLAHLPWLQELPDPLTSAMWSSWVEINPRTAARLAIAEGDLVEIASRHGSVRAPALLSPGIAPDIVAMPVGQGHETFTRVASGRGANPIALLAPVVEPDTGSLAWAATRVRVTRLGDGNGELILFAGEAREHPHDSEGR